MIYLELLFSFIKIGLFSFGGGYAMIPLIQKEIETYGWISASEFVDIIAISEMTPGPIAVNSATFIGYRSAGVLGSMAATFGVALPSVVLILIISRFFFRFQDKPANIMIFYGVRPAVTGLIASAAIFVADTSLLREGIAVESFVDILKNLNSFIDIGGIAIIILTLVALLKLKLHPIIVILGAGVAGVVIYSIFPSLSLI